MAGFKGYGISLLIDAIAGLLSGSACLNRVGRFYSDDNKSMNVGFCITVMDPKQIFGDDYDIAIRGGLQCAPLIHRALGTIESGLIRASFSAENSKSEIDELLSALREIDERTF